MTHIHIQKVNFKGQSVRKADRRTDATNRFTFPANWVAIQYFKCVVRNTFLLPTVLEPNESDLIF